MGARHGPLQAALGVHPLQLLGQEQQGGHGRGVVGLILAGVADRGGQREELRDVPAGGGDLLDPGQGLRGHDRDPQATVGGEALLRREVVDVRLGDVDGKTGGAAGRVDEHERVLIGPRDTLDRCGHTGGGLVVGEGVDVHTRLGDRLAVRSGLGGDDRGLTQPGGALGDLGELAGELAERQMLGLLTHQPVRGDVPEGRGAAVAEHDLVSVGQGEQFIHARADPGHQGLHRLLSVGSAHVVGP